VGCDLSAAFLDQAGRDAAAAGLAVEYVEGDMRALPWTGRFDHVLVWFTAYGYFDDEQNRQVLAQAYRALKPGGKLLIDLNNRDFLLAHYQHTSVVERDGNYMIDLMRYDIGTGRNHTERIVVRDGQTRRMQFFVRLFTFPELRTWLEQVGFQAVSGYDQVGGPLTTDSRRMIVVAVR
jgi:SAM-dependent methyltransferase